MAKRLSKKRDSVDADKKNMRRAEMISIKTAKLIFRNWKLFLPFPVITGVVVALVMGASMDTLITFGAITFLLIWLVSLFFARHLINGDNVKFRDGLYNAFSPIVSTLMVFLVLAVECVPVMLVIIGYSAALETELFGNMFYGSLFVLFAIIMVVITLWLVSGNLLALIAVTTPGMYPGRALMLVREVMRGRKIKMMLTIVKLVLISVMVELICMLPVIIIGIVSQGDVSTAGIIVTILVSSMMTAYAAVYLYIYYRKIIDINKDINE